MSLSPTRHLSHVAPAPSKHINVVPLLTTKTPTTTRPGAVQGQTSRAGGRLNTGCGKNCGHDHSSMGHRPAETNALDA